MPMFIIINKMATIYLTQKNGNDDIITVSHDEAYRSMYKIVYAANDSATKSKFYLCERDTMDYVSDVLKSLNSDVDSFVNIQITTAIHPSIMYCVPDLADDNIRWQIEDMILAALRTNVHRVKATN